MANPEIRDAGQVHDEQVAGFAAAIQAAMSTAGSQQQQAQVWMDGSFQGEGDVVRPGASDAPGN